MSRHLDYLSTDNEVLPEATIDWLREQHLDLPAWMLLECVRPFGWVLGQFCLFVEPLSRGLGWEQPLATLMAWLDRPERLTALSEALAPDQEANEC